MKKYLIPNEGKFFKANLHCHSTYSDGKLTIEILQVENIGRDKSIVARNPFSEKDTVRFIVDSDSKVEEGQTVKVNIKPHKYHVFDKVTEVRVK